MNNEQILDFVIRQCVKYGLPMPETKYKGTRICVGNAYMQETSRKGRWNVSDRAVRLDDVPLLCGMSESEAIKTLLVSAFRDRIYMAKELQQPKGAE